jgi:hypothetical protein
MSYREFEGTRILDIGEYETPKLDNRIPKGNLGVVLGKKTRRNGKT